MLRKLILTGVIVVATVLTGAPAIAAGDGCKQVEVCDANGTCKFELICPGGDDENGGDPSDPVAITKCVFAGVEIACTSTNGNWSNAHGCWLRPMDNQDKPPEGKKDEDGDWYYCTPPPPYIVPPGGVATVWIDGPAIVFVDPGPLAEQALDTMSLAKPEVHLAPQPPLLTYVGLETWLWTPENQWGVLTASVSAGGATVTATATPLRVRWDMTEGVTRCSSAGRAWVKGMSSEEETTCSYTYDNVSDGQPDDAFEVNAQMFYAVTWTCTGPCLGTEGSLGVVPGPLSDSSNLRVGERQSVVIR